MLVANASTFNLAAFLVGAVALIVLIVWQQYIKKIPGSLIAVVVGALAVEAFKLRVRGDHVNLPGRERAKMHADILGHIPSTRKVRLQYPEWTILFDLQISNWSWSRNEWEASLLLR